jgi:subtilisin family serine protease
MMKLLLVHWSRVLVTCFCGLLSLALAPTVSSGVSGFAAKSESDTVTVIVIPQLSGTRGVSGGLSSINSAEFRNLLTGMTRRQRYDFVRTRLEKEAETANHILQPKLDSALSAGQIISYKSHWILASFAVTLPEDKIEPLAALQSVSEVVIPPKPQLIASNPINRAYRFAGGASAQVESNLESVRARAAWSRGYTGAGRIICSFDTGIDGRHPALRATWKGLDGESSSAWFDPIEGKSFPHVIKNTSLPDHGSHTMGIMVGRDTLSGDTVGVAPGARWISAAVIDIPGASIVDAFEWAADPDRDPNTISDVPDVINHSWGAPNSVLGCDELFHRLITNTEALGIVNIFAAGNEGRQGAQTIRNPANRALDSIDCFAVGFVDHRTPGSPTLAVSSSRGPSDCDGASVKPNVVAPGVNILSSIPNGKYGYSSGSSMAAPHVAGIVALLRQKNPDASPEQIKSALLVGARDVGSPGPDNDYGWGYINALAALDEITELERPALRVTALTPNRPDEAGVIRARVRIENVSSNAAATAVRGRIVASPVSASVISGLVTFGSLAPGASVSSIEDIVIEVDDTLSAGSVIPFDFLITADNGIRQLDRLFVLIGDRVNKQFYTHQSDRMSFTVSNFGEYGFADGSYTPLGFAGLRFEDEKRSSLFEMAFILGLDATHVSDGIRNIGLQPDRDFSPAAGGALSVTTHDIGSGNRVTNSHNTNDSAINGHVADFETVSSFADTLAETPLGFTVRQRTFSWRQPPLDNVVVIDYTIVNNSGFSVGGVHAGMFADWDIGSLNQNLGSFDPQNELGFLAYINGDTSMFRGIAVLNAKGLTGHFVQNMSEFGNLRNPFTESFKYRAISSRFERASVFEQGDLAHFVSTGPYTITSGDSAHAVFAIVAGNNLAELQSTVSAVTQELDSILSSEETPGASKPTTFRLDQNYPNPFNPPTRIGYALEAPGEVILTIYNVLGQRVRELVSAWQDADEYSVKWDGVDDDDNLVASGMYFYRLKRGDQILTRKMILLK